MTSAGPVYAVADHVGQVDRSEDGESAVCYVAALPEGPPLVLRDSGAEIWWAVREGGTLDEITHRVAERVGVPAADIIADVAAFLDDLVARGLLCEE